MIIFSRSIVVEVLMVELISSCDQEHIPFQACLYPVRIVPYRGLMANEMSLVTPYLRNSLILRPHPAETRGLYQNIKMVTFSPDLPSQQLCGFLFFRFLLGLSFFFFFKLVSLFFFLLSFF